MRIAFACAAFALCFSVPALSEDVSGTGTSGIFLNPSPGSVVTGVGTSSFTHGTSINANPPNVLTFTGVSGFAAAFEEEFKIGSLYYFNGTTAANTQATSVNLSINLNFTQPPLGVVNSLFTLSLNSTPNTGTEDENADYVYFPATYGGSSFDIGGTTYFVELTGFKNIQGDGFLASNSSELHVRENLSATADLYARVTATVPLGVPEPASWAMMMAGLGLLGGVLRRARAHGCTLRFA